MDEAAKLLAIIFERSWQFEVLTDWKGGKHKKGGEKTPMNCRPASLTSVPGNIREQSLLKALLSHMYIIKLVLLKKLPSNFS